MSIGSVDIDSPENSLNILSKEAVLQDLDNQLNFLERRFSVDFSKIIREKRELEKEGQSLNESAHVFGSHIESQGPKMQPVPSNGAAKDSKKVFSHREEVPLRQKLAKKRAIADELEDKLQAARNQFPEELEKIALKQSEIGKREKLLLKSVEEIEIYLKAVFHMRLEANAVHIQQSNELRESEAKYKDLSVEFNRFKRRRVKMKDLIGKLQPMKDCMDEILAYSNRFSDAKDMVNYYHILKHLNRDLIEKELTYQLEEKNIKEEEEKLAKAIQLHPYELLSRDNAYHEKTIELKREREKTTMLEEKMDIVVTSKANEDSLWAEIQRWIKKIHRSVLGFDIPIIMDSKDEILNNLNRISEFISIATDVVDTLKQRKQAA